MLIIIFLILTFFYFLRKNFMKKTILLIVIAALCTWGLGKVVDLLFGDTFMVTISLSDTTVGYKTLSFIFFLYIFRNIRLRSE